MQDALLLTMIFAASYGAFGLLAVSQSKHWKRIARGPHCPSVRGYRIGGSSLLALAFVLAVLRDGAGLGSLLWITAVSAAAIAVAFTITWRPRWLGAVFRIAGA